MARMRLPVGRATDPSRNSPSSVSITAANAITASGVHMAGLLVVRAGRMC
jgi:hypothetical protein